MPNINQFLNQTISLTSYPNYPYTQPRMFSYVDSKQQSGRERQKIPHDTPNCTPSCTIVHTASECTTFWPKNALNDGALQPKIVRNRGLLARVLQLVKKHFCFYGESHGLIIRSAHLVVFFMSISFWVSEVMHTEFFKRRASAFTRPACFDRTGAIPH